MIIAVSTNMLASTVRMTKGVLAIFNKQQASILKVSHIERIVYEPNKKNYLIFISIHRFRFV